MSNIPEQAWQTAERVLAEGTAAAAGTVYRYRLTDRGEGEARFSLSVSGGGEQREEALGDDVCFAVDCYRAVRDGAVTPCTLADVTGDLKVLSGVSPRFFGKNGSGA